MKKKVFFTVFCLALGVMCSWAQQTEYKTVQDIVYTQSGDDYAQQRGKLDVYYPQDAHDCPVVVWYHGGGIEGGNKYIPEELKNKGYVVVAANYRLLPNVPVDSVFDDVAASIAWTFKNIAKYGGSTEKIYLSGHSAGGYLISMVGLDKSWLAKYDIDADRVKALIPFSGQMITHYNHRKMHGISPIQPIVDRYAPLYFVRKDCPPLLLITGDREIELLGRYEENAYMYRMMKLVGHEQVYLYELDGHDHVAMAHPAFHILIEYIKKQK